MLDERYATSADHIGHLPTYEAYQAFDQGMDLLLEDYNSQDALRHFLQAFELDSTFYTALIYAAIPVFNRGGRQLMDSILHVLTSNADRLSEYDRHWVRVHQAVIDADHEAALRAARSAARLAPQSRAAYLHAYLLELLNRPREELQVLAAIDPERGGMRGNWLYWIRVIVAHHMLGEHVQELDAVRRAREQYPDLTFFRGYEVGALAALDRVDDVRQILVEVEDQTRNYYVAPAVRAHGHIRLARETCAQWVQWLRALSAEEAARRGNRFALAFALYYADEWAEALPIAEELVAEFHDVQRGGVRTLDVTNYLGLLGVIRARLGDREGALDISERLAAMDTDEFLDLDNRTAWRAQIAALLGEHAEAVRLLQEKARQGWVYVPWLHHYAALEPLRDYPPFQEFMRPKG
jgi:tetratricopeptide (TPR) repeat protein